MRKALASALTLGVLAGALIAPSAEAGKKAKRVERKVKIPYDNPAIGVAGIGACSGCPQIATGPKDLYASVKAIDDVSPTAYVDISWDTDGDEINDTGFVVCGKTEEPQPIPGGTTLVAFPWVFPGPDCLGFSTSGTLKITFSNLP
jgi:hypothetical protein